MSPRRSIPTKKEKQRSGLPIWVIIGAAAVVVLIGIALVVVGMGGSQTPTPVATSVSGSGIPQQGRILGDQNAPITLVDYSDFQ